MIINMKTLEKLEASRGIVPTRFHPKELEEMKLVRYLATSGTASNKNLDTNLFDSIHKMNENGSFVQAIGYIGLKPTILIFKR